MTGQPIKTLSADEAQLWLYNLELNFLKGKLRTSNIFEEDAAYQICHRPFLIIDLLGNKRYLESDIDRRLTIRDPTVLAKQRIRSCEGSGIKLSEAEKFNLIEKERDRREQYIKKNLENNIAALEAKEIKLPQVRNIRMARPPR